MKFDFLQQVDNESKTPKSKFQLFEVRLGFEPVKVIVPFDLADDFESTLNEEKPTTKARLKSIMQQFKGEFE